MSNKVSDLTIRDFANYLRLDFDDLTESDKKELETLKGVASSYIKGMTGVQDLDSHEDFIIVMLVLVQDMYDNRSLYTDGKNSPNKIVESILNMHRVNFM